MVTQVKMPRDVSSGQGWADLACALQDLKEKNSMAASWRQRGREEEGPSVATAAVQMTHQPGVTDQQNLGSGDLSLQLGSSASYSTPSSSSNSRASADQYDAPPTNDLSPDDLSFLQDVDVRSMFKKVTVNATLLNHAIERLGGGRKGMKALLGYIKLWVKDKNNTLFSISQCMESLQKLHQAPAAETLQLAPPAVTLQAPAFGASSTAVLDYNVSPHAGGHWTTTTPPPGLWREQITNRDIKASNNGSNGLKRPLSQSFEPLLDQSPEGGAHLLHHNAKVCKTYGGSFADTVDMNAGFSSSRSEDMVCSEMTGLTTCNLATTVRSFAGTDANVLAHDVLIHNNNNSSHMAVNQPLVASTLQQKGVGGFRLVDAADNNSSSSFLSPAASKRAARKIRMARQRRSTLSMVSHSARKTDSLHLLLQKDLRPSDIGSLGRIILPKKESELHLPSLTLKGVFISMEDFDTRMTWSFQYRYWPNNRSRMYLLEGTGEFVKAHDLEEGDLLMIYKNRQGNFVIRGKKKGLCSEACVPTTTTTTTTAVHLPNNNNTHSLARVPFDGGIKVKKAEEELPNDGKKNLHRNVPLVEDCSSYKPVEPFDIFLQEVMQGIQNEYEECGEVLSQLERFPSLDPDVSVDDILGLTFAGGSGSGGISSVIPKIEPAS
ncbi:unnamed protein product [Sphagnum jensenii]|uniref:TF-B3 domain-containing protein n=1 Tax=Sphagnum jensenii TaxID=128206 RepID=A0ABP0WRX6_9BRYO